MAQAGDKVAQVGRRQEVGKQDSNMVGTVDTYEGNDNDIDSLRFRTHDTVRLKNAHANAVPMALKLAHLLCHHLRCLINK